MPCLYDTCSCNANGKVAFFGNKVTDGKSKNMFWFFLFKFEAHRVDWQWFSIQIGNLSIFCVEDVGVGIWKQHIENIIGVNLSVVAYQMITSINLASFPSVLSTIKKLDEICQYLKQGNMWMLTISDLQNVNKTHIFAWWVCHCSAFVTLGMKVMSLYSPICSTFLVTNWEVMFLHHKFVLNTKRSDKILKLVLNFNFFKTRWKCLSNCFCFVIWLFACECTPHDPEHFCNTCWP